MDINDIILALRNGLNPNDAVMAGAGAQGGPPGPPPVAPGEPPSVAANRPPGPPPSPPPASAPQGVRTPVTNPMPSDAAPRTMQSPPDLANMYLTLMKDNKNAAALDSGATLIAAGLSNRPENRSALIQGALNQKQGHQITAADIVNLQKMQIENQALAIRQAAKGGLMKKYRLDRDTLDYLDASGKLDEVIKHHNTQNLVQGTDAGTGQTSFYNASTGEKVVDIGGPKKPETQFIEGKDGQELRRRDTGELILPGVGTKPLEDQVKLDAINAERTKAGQAPVTMEDYLKTIKRDAPQEPNAADRAALDQINAERKASGKPAMAMEDFVKSVKRTDQNEQNKAVLDQINAERSAAGKKPMTTEEFLKLKGGGVTVNVGPNGEKFPAPAQGQDYIRNEDGTVKVGTDGKPTLYTIQGAEPLTADTEKKHREESEAKLKKDKANIQKAMTANNVVSAADRALELVNKPGVTGLGNKLVRSLSPGGMPSDSYDAAVSTISSNTAISALQAMRESSPTGGALGNVTDYENRMLSSTIADLRSAQRSEDAERALIRVKATFATMLAQRYEGKEGDDARFRRDLQQNIDEMTVEHVNRKNARGESKYKVTPK